MARAIVGLIVVAYAPGAVCFRVPLWARADRAALPAEERAFWAVILSVAWSLAVVLVLAALNRYSFARLVGIDGAIAGAIVLVLQRRLGFGGAAPRPTASILIPVGLIALGGWLYLPPSEYVIGGKDPGTYINEGVQLAQRGTLVIHDDDVASVPAAFRGLFFPSYHDPSYYSLRFMGFFVQSPDDGRVIGQFPQLFPASIAIGYGLDGLTGARATVGAWTILGLLAVYFAGARLFGRLPAAVAATLLAINVIEVWFGRYPNSEIATQALLFAALLAFARTATNGRGFFGAIAGALLGLMLFLRYEVLLATFAVAIAAILAPAARKRVGLAFPVALAIVSAFGFWYLTGPLIAYAVLPLAKTRESHGWWLVAAGLGAAWIVRRAIRHDAIAAVVRILVPWAAAIVLVVLAVYAYFFRHEADFLALGDAMALRSFGWYVTAPLLAVGVLAVAFFTATRFWDDAGFFLTLAAFSVFFFYKTHIVPEHFWAARRFLVVPLPGMLLAIGGLADRVLGPSALARAFRGRGTSATSAAGPSRAMAWAGTMLVIAALAPAAVAFWRASTPIVHYVEYEGLIPRLERLAGRIGDRDLVVVESRNAGSDLHVLALPLAYVYARHVLVLNSPIPAKRTLDAFVAWAHARYANVWFLGGGGTDLLTKHIAAIPVASDRFQVPEYDAALNAYPSGVRHKEFEYGLYRLVPAPAVPPGPIDLPIGALDDLNVVRFYAKEIQGTTGVGFRWTHATSYILLMGVAPDARRLTIWMSTGGRPRTAPPATVTVSFGDRVLGTATPVNDLGPYGFDLPPDLVARAAASDEPARLTLQVATWNPATLLGGTDTRDLGVMVTRVQVQ